MDILILLNKVLSFTVPTLLIMAVGLAVAEILMETGILYKISKLGRPLSRFANLPEVCGVAIATAMLSFLAANTMLQSMRENKVLTDRETLLASLLTGVVAPVKETFTYHLPVILPALGLYTGTIYIATLWLGSFSLLFFVMVASRILLRDRKVEWHGVRVNNVPHKTSRSFRSALFRFTKRFARIGGTFLLVTLVVFTLMETGLMTKIEYSIMPLSEKIRLPGVVLPAIATYIASPIIGISMMGSLRRDHVVNDNQAIRALLFGSIFMLPLLYMRFYFPQWVSVFGLKLGLIRGLISVGLVMMVRTTMLLVFMNL
ncbi:MAG: hypothetical protein N2260_05375 [Syntrophobacterales bacterium]|nr:hypothetical protein [Syntrophobacterales bacterium]